MELVYTAEIDEEIYNLDGLLKTLNEVVSDGTGCNVLKSKIESPDEVCEDGEWEDE